MTDISKKNVQRITLPASIPYLAKKGQLLLPKGSLPILAKTPAEIVTVERALAKGRTIGIIQPLKENKNQKQLYQIGCVGRITTFSQNDDGSLYIVLKGIKRFRALAVKSGFLQVDYRPYENDKEAFKDDVSQKRDHLMGLLKGYLDRTNINVSWKNISSADNESLITSLAMMCPFDASEKQAILESKSLGERMKMLTAFIEMSQLNSPSPSWTAH